MGSGAPPTRCPGAPPRQPLRVARLDPPRRSQLLLQAMTPPDPSPGRSPSPASTRPRMTSSRSSALSAAVGSPRKSWTRTLVSGRATSRPDPPSRSLPQWLLPSRLRPNRRELQQTGAGSCPGPPRDLMGQRPSVLEHPLPIRIRKVLKLLEKGVLDGRFAHLHVLVSGPATYDTPRPRYSLPKRGASSA